MTDVESRPLLRSVYGLSDGLDLSFTVLVEVLTVGWLYGVADRRGRELIIVFCEGLAWHANDPYPRE